MEKTKLGISVELMAVIAVLACYFGGYTGMFLVVGYILIAETDEWLKKVAVKAAVITIVCSFIYAVVELIPDVVSCIDTIIGIVSLDFSIAYLSWLVNSINSLVALAKTFVILVMAYMALKHSSLDIPVIDNFVAKHMGEKVEEVKAEEKAEEKAE